MTTEPLSTERLDELGRKPRVTVAQCRLLAHLWPYARQYDKPHMRSEIVADIFDGWLTRDDVRPLLDGGLVYPVHSYDPHGNPKHYHSWNLTPLGERAVFGNPRASQSAAALRARAKEANDGNE